MRSFRVLVERQRADPIAAEFLSVASSAIRLRALRFSPFRDHGRSAQSRNRPVLGGTAFAVRSLWVDAVEKVLGMAALRNNRIIESDFLNRSCAFEACLELILLGDPPENLFSTASVILRKDSPRAHLFRVTPGSRRRRGNAALRIRAMSGHCSPRLIPRKSRP